MRIIGIDVGTKSIKILEMESAFGRFDIHDYYEREATAGSDPYEILGEMIRALAKAPDRIVVALPSGKVTLRNLQLPTREKKAIQAGVGFELEDELPFTTEDSQFDYTILTQNKQGSLIHVAATLKKHLTDLIGHLSRGRADADVVTTEPWAYRLLLNRLLASHSLPGCSSPTEPILLVNLGHEKTTLYVHCNSTPSFIREVRWGGRDLDTAISQKFALSLDQAELAKRDRGIIFASKKDQEFSPERVEIATVLEENLSLLATEIRQTELMCRNLTGQKAQHIFLTGGTSLLTGLPEWVENKTQIPTRLLSTLSSLTPSGVTYSEQTNAQFSLAAALAMCQVGTQKAGIINFRKGRFQKKGKTRELNFKELKKPLTAAGLVAASLFLSLTVQSFFYGARLATLNPILEKKAKNFFKTATAAQVRSYVSKPSTLKTAVLKEIAKQRDLARLSGPNPHSPLDLLKSLSSAIPKDVVGDLLYLQTGTPSSDPYSTAQPQASLAFLVANPQVAERLNAILEAKFTDLNRGPIEETTNPETQIKKWKVSFTGKPKDDNYEK